LQKMRERSEEREEREIDRERERERERRDVLYVCRCGGLSLLSLWVNEEG